MTTIKHPEIKVFVDADVLFAGAASPSEHSASLQILRLSEITLLEALTSERVLIESQRNLELKLPQVLPAFNHLVSRCLRVVPEPSSAEEEELEGLAHAGDRHVLAGAVREECPWLVTFNTRHFDPGYPDVAACTPGEFIRRVRVQLSQLKGGWLQ